MTNDRRTAPVVLPRLFTRVHSDRIWKVQVEHAAINKFKVSFQVAPRKINDLSTKGKILLPYSGRRIGVTESDSRYTDH